MNLLKLLTDFFEVIKNYTGRRFYFTVFICFIFSVLYIYKDPLSEFMKSSSVKFEFRECRNEQGLKSSLDNLQRDNQLVTSYAVYLYQPKDKAVYKTCVLTNNKMLVMSTSLKSIYLKDQYRLNEALRTSGYVIIQRCDNRFDTSILSDFDIDSVLVYKICNNDWTIGEIILSLKRPPSAYELDKLLRSISPLSRNYIL